jgi:DNA mismatch repair protein MutS2
MLEYMDTLELPAILHRLAEHASFSAGKERARSLVPSADLDEVRYRQQETTEARKLLEVKPDLRLGGVHDLRPFIDTALRGARLLPHDLLDIRDTLDSTRRLKRSLLRLQESFPTIASIARRFEPCPELIAEIERCIGDHGDVLDRASSTLARTRSELKVAYERLMDRLNRIVANSNNARYLQEAYVTQRDGRYVIPVKSDFKTRIPGLVHDQSASGATLFIEPIATVALNNRWRELQLAEEHEVARILLALSALVAEQDQPIRLTVEALSDLDLALAKAQYADAIRGTMPEMVPFAPPSRPSHARRTGAIAPKGGVLRHPGSVIDLRQARHPLLDPKTVVPIDVKMGDDYFCVVITGPNTGGKTVSLKTVGLSVMMAQCGLHVPADEGSVLTVFEQICADIGDEQSIEQSLSTFSSHMSHIIEMLESADDRSLILLDELGAGTDPLEGAALAQSLLLELLGRRITTLATTHYPELKVFAEQTPGVVNASVEFDVETLAPTYHLTIGLPGQSNAFAIASRLGLPETIVSRARSLVSASHLEAERFLVQIKETQAQAAEAQAEAERASAQAREMADELRARLDGIERERTTILNQARAQAAEELDAMRKELRSMRRKLAIMSTGPSATLVASDVDAELEALVEELEPIAPAAPPASPALAPASEPVTVEAGDTVWVPDLNALGEVLALDGEAAEVQIGAFRVRTRSAALELRHKAASPAPDAPETRVAVPPAPPVSVELHLRGLRVDEALPRLDRYLDDAYRSQAPFARIVHGKGTGRLRSAVREALRNHPFVSSFRGGEQGEGDTGVTVVKFVGH